MSPFWSPPTVEFYTKHLGFKVEQQFGAGVPFASVSRGGLTLWLSGPKSSGARPVPDGRKQEPGGWNRIVLEVDDLAAHVEAIANASPTSVNVDWRRWFDP